MNMVGQPGAPVMPPPSTAMADERERSLEQREAAVEVGERRITSFHKAVFAQSADQPRH